MRHGLLSLADGRSVFSGGMAGRKLLTALIATTPSSEEAKAVFLDFKGVEVATSSFLRGAVIGFRDYARRTLINVYPVAANMAPAVLEELEFFVRARNDVFWICDLDATEQVSGARLLGDLDPAQRATFDAVRDLGAVTAPELAARFSDQTIGPTAWNNRLSGLAAKGVLIERKVGKTKSFSSLLEIV
ncbi:hypothetical protein [Bradyrhizobium sp. CB3481]|uniref:hypothetical protein n=1 Tax=Bradyrhizobium sp. CB3481 TaxID=3039158 RepID=UPI0024B0A343|nr:hypothetical protein [Bradyrhizobium sp. CB3481]WFU14407.1 hypothetical protein QA643_24830 [Bradyrhizobium sp. CB3481]